MKKYRGKSAVTCCCTYLWVFGSCPYYLFIALPLPGMVICIQLPYHHLQPLENKDLPLSVWYHCISFKSSKYSNFILLLGPLPAIASAVSELLFCFCHWISVISLMNYIICLILFQFLIVTEVFSTLSNFNPLCFTIDFNIKSLMMVRLDNVSVCGHFWHELM